MAEPPLDEQSLPARPAAEAETPPAPTVTSELEGAIKLAGAIVGLAGFVYLIGGVLTWIRLAAARVPADAMTAVVDQKVLFVVGLKAIAFAAVVFIVISVVAYAIGAAVFPWRKHRVEWHAVVTRGPREAAAKQAREGELDLKKVEAPLGDSVVQAVVGLNFAVLGGIIALAAAKVVEEVFTSAAGVVAPLAVVTAVIAVFLAARLGPLSWHGRWQVAVLVAPAVFIAIFAAAPIGVLVLASVAIARLGQVIARTERPRSIAAVLRAPLPWALLAVYLLVAAAFVAQAPISFTRAIVTTSKGSQTGGYIARTSDGVYLITCRGLADATSREERTVLIPASGVKSTTFGGEPFRVDPGERASLATLVFRAAGIRANIPTWFRADLRTRGTACGGVARPAGTIETALGSNVLVASAPAGRRASGDEATVDETSPALAALAHRFQPTVEVSIADRFWPVSVASVLSDRGTLGYALLHGGHRATCLIKGGRCAASPPALADLSSAGASPNDYLDYPATLDRGDPTGEFEAFGRGQGIAESTIDNWLAEPAALDPWSSAQVYFYDAGVGGYSARYGAVPPELRSLQYWFFYPYNYYPTVVADRLMLSAPVAGDLVNTDLHEGDWEHVSVLLDPKTLQPRYLYMARHDQEGETYAWDRGKLHFDGGHPIVQAALGGHPTYPDTCGRYRRAYVKGILSDWVVCAPARFAFRASTTPLVDLAHASWACWPGHFGEATPTQVRNGNLPESDPRRYIAKYVLVAGPRSPLRQAENARVCK